MSLHIKATRLTKIFPVDPLDYLSYIAFGRSLRGDASTREVLREKVAVNDANFEFATGDRVGIIGRNGAGKSTLVSMIAGLTRPTSGTLEVEGRVTAVMTLGIGLREDQTGRENIYLDGELQGKSRREMDQVIDEIVGFAELGEFIDYPIRTYSTGMKARLAFSLIINLEPEILIIDEALSVGDAFFSEKATRKIREICDRGKIVIVVSHGMDSITQMCNRCLWLDSGRIVMDGEPSRVTAAYVSAVRETDEKELRQKFHGLLGRFPIRDGGEIGDLRITDAESGADRTIFPIGGGCRVAFSVTVGDALDAPRLAARITRLDGLLVSEAVLDSVEHGIVSRRPGLQEIELELSPLVLGRGVFQITLELADAAGPIAESRSFIQMQSPEPEIGGRALLATPFRLLSEPEL